MKEEIKVDYAECGTTDGDEIFKVIKSFYVVVRAGPTVSLPVGCIARLTGETARENFPFRVLPIDLKDPGQYEVIEGFRTADPEGYWQTLNVGDILELSLEEALPWMREFKIKPKKGGENKK